MTKSIKSSIETVDETITIIYCILSDMGEYKDIPYHCCKGIYKELINVDGVDLESILYIMDTCNLNYKKLKNAFGSNMTSSAYPNAMTHEVFIEKLKELDIECLNDLREHNKSMVISKVLGFKVPEATIE